MHSFETDVKLKLFYCKLHFLLASITQTDQTDTLIDSIFVGASHKCHQCQTMHVGGTCWTSFPPPPPLYWEFGPHTYRDVQCSVNHVKRNVCCRVSQAEEHGSAGVWPPGHQSQCHCGHSVPYESQQLDTRGGVHTKQTNTCWETLFGGAWLIVWQSHKWVDI